MNAEEHLSIQTTATPAKSGTPPHDVFLSLQRLALALNQEVADLLKTRGLSAPQFNILRILRGARVEPEGETGLACSEIGARLLTHAPDLTRLLDRMAAQCLVVRARTPNDRRVVAARITDKGLALLAELDAPLTALHTEQLGHLGPERLAALKALLEAARPKRRPADRQGTRAQSPDS